MKQYLDVTVEIEPPGTTGAAVPYRVRITSFDGRRAEATLQLPFTLADLAGVVAGAADVSRKSSDDEPASTGTKTPKEFGEALFRALFTGDVRSILDKAIGVADDRQNTGLRLRLSMNLGDAGMTEVASIPWELLRDPSDPATPLVLSSRRLLVRSLDVPLPSEPHPFEKPLRILVVIANPKGTAPLRLEEERARIEKAWGQLQGTELHFAKPVEHEIRATLASADFHVVHFMGHGEFTGAGGGMLLFEDDAGNKAPVSGDLFTEWLHNELPALRLVFLNACQTAQTTTRTGVDPFSGVATSLIRGGIPAVVAMQFPISDRGAIAFADTFYQQIVAGAPVDAAVSEARKQLGPEFATPVLYMRSADGALFTPAAVAPTPITTSPPQAVSQQVVAPQQVQMPVQQQMQIPVQQQAQMPAPQPMMQQIVSPAPSADVFGPGDGARILLAAVNERLRPQQRTLARQLREAGLRVLDTLPPPYDAPEHAAAVTAAARAADLCVHLLGDSAGEPYDEADPLLTYPLEQLRIGLKVANSLLVLIPDEVDIGTIADSAYKGFVGSLIERPRDGRSFELVRTGKHQLADEIRAKLQKLRDAAAQDSTSSALRSAFVDAHRVDRDAARALEDLLTAQQIDVTLKTTAASPSEAMAQFDVNLASYPLYIVVAGSADPAWVKFRATAASKTAAKQEAQAIVAEFSVGADQGRTLRIRYDNTEDSRAKEALLAELARRGPA